MAREYKAEYARRIARASEKGFSKAQARGHARTSKGEKPLSQIRSTLAPTRTRTPKVGQRYTNINKGNAHSIVRTNSTRIARGTLNKLQGTTNRGVLRRVYIKVFDPSTGTYQTVYKGNRNTEHGIPVKELLRRINEKLSSGAAKDFDDAFRQTVVEDNLGYGGNDSDDYGTVPYDFTQIHLHFIDPLPRMTRV